MEIEIYVGVDIWPDGFVSIQAFGSAEELRRWRLSHFDSETGEPNDPVIRMITKDVGIDIDDDEVYQYALDNFDNLVNTDDPPERD